MGTRRRRQHPSREAMRAQQAYSRAVDRVADATSRELRRAMRQARLTPDDLVRETGYTRRLVAVAMGNQGEIKTAADLAVADWVALFAACGVQIDFKIVPRTARAKAAAAMAALRNG